jgi:hypothetical protein
MINVFAGANEETQMTQRGRWDLMGAVVLLAAGIAMAEEPGAKPQPGPGSTGVMMRSGGHMVAGREGTFREGFGHGEAILMMVINNPDAAKEAGIGEDQIQTLKNGMYEFRKERVKLGADIELAAMEQAKIMEQANVDENALMACVERKGQIKTAMDKLVAREMLLVKKTLTKEQIGAVRKIAQKQLRRTEQERERTPQERKSVRGLEKHEPRGEQKQPGKPASDGGQKGEAGKPIPPEA